MFAQRALSTTLWASARSVVLDPTSHPPVKHLVFHASLEPPHSRLDPLLLHNVL
ncbi:hypothetical protein ACJMK2_035171, partial [Sinanodonta woodiana]